MINKYTYIKLGISVLLFIIMMVFFGYSLKTYQDLESQNEDQFEEALQNQIKDSNLEDDKNVKQVVAEFQKKQADMKLKQSIVTVMVMVGLLILIVMEGSYLMTKSIK